MIAKVVTLSIEIPVISKIESAAFTARPKYLGGDGALSTCKLSKGQSFLDFVPF